VVAEHLKKKRLVAAFPLLDEVREVVDDVHQRRKAVALLRGKASRVSFIAEKAGFDRSAVQDLKAGLQFG
jgi:hypothetical protein